MVVCKFCVESKNCLCKGRCKNSECQCPTKSVPEPKQNIWRTVSEPSHNGVFVWEVMECDGLPFSVRANYTRCADSTYIYIMCYQYWTTEQAENHLNEQALAEFGAVYHTV